jgi:hypothetical protein
VSLTVTQGSVSGTTGTFNVTNKNALSSFAVANPGNQVAGTAFAVSLTALDQYGNTDTNYTGNQTLTWSGTATASAPDTTAPTLTNPVSFSAGTASPSITLTDALNGAVLTVSQGTPTGSTTGFNVSAAAQASLYLTGITAEPTPAVTCTGPAGNLTTCTSTGGGNGASAAARTLTAQIQLVDTYGNVVTNTTGSAITISLTASGTAGSTLTPASLSVPINQSTTSATFTFTRSSNNGSSNIMTAKVGGTTELQVTLSH